MCLPPQPPCGYFAIALSYITCKEEGGLTIHEREQLKQTRKQHLSSQEKRCIIWMCVSE